MREELLKHCREEFIELPAPDRITRMVRSALHTAESSWFATIAARLTTDVRVRVLALVSTGDMDGGEDEDAADGESVLALVKAMPGNVSLESMLRESTPLDLQVASWADELTPSVLNSVYSASS